MNKIAIISLSLLNLINANTNPNININGKVTLIRLGIIRNESCTISIALICKLFITLKSLDNCNNQATDTKIKKTSIQELTI